MKMSDALHVEEGQAPWLPASNVVAGEVLDFYNVPRAGLLHQSGLTFYFECIIGDGQSVGIWAYSHIDDSEVSALLGAAGPDDFDALTPRLIQNRWVTVAIAADHAIVESSVLDAGEEGALGLAKRMMTRWDQQRAARDEAVRLVDAMPAF